MKNKIEKLAEKILERVKCANLETDVGLKALKLSICEDIKDLLANDYDYGQYDSYNSYPQDEGFRCAC